MPTPVITQTSSPVICFLNAGGTGSCTFDFYGRAFRLYHASILHSDNSGVEGISELTFSLLGGTNFTLLRTQPSGHAPDAGGNFIPQRQELNTCVAFPKGTGCVLSAFIAGSETFGWLIFDYLD